MKKFVNNFLGFVFSLMIIPMIVLGSFELAKQYPTYNRSVCYSYLLVFLWNSYYVIRDWKKPSIPEETITHLNNKKTLGLGCDEPTTNSK